MPQVMVIPNLFEKEYHSAFPVDESNKMATFVPGVNLVEEPKHEVNRTLPSPSPTTITGK